MLNKIHYNSPVFTRLLQPLSALLDRCRHTRRCPELTDSRWLDHGICRVLRPAASTRAFLQSRLNHGFAELLPNTFFDSLNSPRRCRLLGEVLNRLLQQFNSTPKEADPLARFTDLDPFDCHAGDGHFLAAACHDQAPGDTRYPTGHLFSLNLRNGLLNHLTVADQLHRKKEHDLRGLKRQSIEQLRQGAPAGRKVLYVWDKAGIDLRQWHQWKSAGIYFVSLEKENMKPIRSGHPDWDREDPVNRGIQSVEQVGYSAGVSMRRIRYTCPETDQQFVILTNEMTLRPGLIVMLYRLRWNIEKVFDETKNRFGEKKSWGRSATAKTCQGRFICLAYNLAQLMERVLAEEEAISNQPEQRRRERRARSRAARLGRVGKRMPGWINALSRLTQRGVKLIRWLADLIWQNLPWEQATAILRRHYRRL